MHKLICVNNEGCCFAALKGLCKYVSCVNNPLHIFSFECLTYSMCLYWLFDACVVSCNERLHLHKMHCSLHWRLIQTAFTDLDSTYLAGLATPMGFRWNEV